MQQTCAGRILSICACLILASCSRGNDDGDVAAAGAKIGGRVTGLAGTGLVLQLNGGQSLAVSRNGRFVFDAELGSGVTYSVTATAQPSAPSQTCTVTRGGGVIDSGDVDFVAVTCATNTYTIGGSVSGLSGTLVLQNRGGDDLSISTSSPFTFPTRVASGDTYGVTIKSQPASPAQECVLTNPGGIVAATNVTVSVACTNIPLTLLSTNPPAGATNVLRSFPLRAYFSTAVNSATVTAGNISLSSSGGAAPANLTAEGNTLTFALTRLLLPQTTYTLTAGTGLRGSLGEQMAAPVSTSFTTRDGSWRAAQVVEPPPVNLSGFPPFSPRMIACSADGTAVAVWVRAAGSIASVWTSRYVPGTGWGTASPIENVDNYARSASVAMDGNGNAIAVWQQNDNSSGTSPPYSIWAARFTPAGDWGPPVRIENNGNDAADPSVAMDSAGNAVVVWLQSNGSINQIWSSRYIAASNTWSAAASIQSVAQRSDDVVVSMNASGTAFAVWSQYDGIANMRVWGNRYVPGTGWGAAAQVQSTTQYSSAADVAVDAGGNAIATWSEDGGSNRILWANRYVAGTGWSGAAVIKSGATYAEPPRIAMNSTGQAVVVWNQSDGNVNNTLNQVWVNRYVPSNGWAGAAQIPGRPPDQQTGGVVVAVDESGNAVAVWAQYNDVGFQTWGARFNPSVGWGAAAAISGSVDAYGHSVATDASGNALAVWIQPGGGGSTAANRLWSARFE